MALTPVALATRALIKIGASPIAAFDEGTIESEVAHNLYPSVRDALLSSHPWSFATAQTELQRLSSVPRADYAYAYQLPPDFLRALSAGEGARGRGLDYRIAEHRLHANAEQIVLTYIFRPSENAFPPFFDHLLIATLAAEFCVPLTESTARAESLAQAAEGAFRRAKLIDSQQNRADAIEDFTLTAARL